jgi:hypothetical protein
MTNHTWQQIVTQHSGRNLKLSRDKLMAISGLSRLVQWRPMGNILLACGETISSGSFARNALVLRLHQQITEHPLGLGLHLTVPSFTLESQIWADLKTTQQRCESHT